MPNKGDLIRDLWSFTSCRQFVARPREIKKGLIHTMPLRAERVSCPLSNGCVCVPYPVHATLCKVVNRFKPDM